MSQYISSFVEPVFRQARRLSSPTIDNARGRGPATPPGNGSAPQLPRATSAEDRIEAGQVIHTSFHTASVGQGVSRQSVFAVPRGAEEALYGESYLVARADEARANPVIPTVRLRSAQALQMDNGSPAESMTEHETVSSLAPIEAGHSHVNERPHVWGISRPLTPRSTAPSPAMDGLLPEDDGMGAFRKRIIAIQSWDRPIEERSQLVHALMTERYRAQATFRLKDPVPTLPTPGVDAFNRPVTSESASSAPESLLSSPAMSRSSCGAEKMVVSAEDRRPTYHTVVIPKSTEGGKEKEERVLGCSHYRRNVKIQCSTCARWYTCRFCHDQREDHALVRHETRHMLCMFCGTAQAAAEQCRSCEQPAAWYFCRICKLWDNDPTKSIYHCDECGICRVGQGLGKDFFHCKVRRFPACRPKLILEDMLGLSFHFYS